MATAKETMIEAFLNLLYGKSFEELTVKDIVLQAKVSRSTFYLHFMDKYELMEDVRKTLNDQFLSFYTDQMWPAPVTACICRHVFMYRSFYSREFSDANATYHLSNRLTICLFQAFQDQDYAIFASYGTIGYLSSWVREGFNSSPGEAAEKLMKIGATNWARILLPEVDRSK